MRVTHNSTIRLTKLICGPFQMELEFGNDCWFLRRGENWSTRRIASWSKDENQQQTQPTFDAESGNRTLGGLHKDTC